MTIKALINKIKEEKPNSFSDEKLLSFVNDIEAEVAEDLHTEDFEPYEGMTDEDDNDISLILPKPFDCLYVSYLKAQIDYANEEYASYENNQAQHIQDYRDFIDWAVRTGQYVDESFPTRLKNYM